ncbi:MAG: sugar phosphate isomerase/epimerase family protein [Clostridiales bacterium]|nr:sugar phosphate isomerase/epimerase family protein [Clostridiales bacterium]
MEKKEIIFGVFTKPWTTQSLDELGNMLSKMGFNGVEFCLRKGYQIEPESAKEGLKKLVSVMKKYGIAVTSIGSSTDENIFEACAEAGVPIIRTLAPIDLKKGYNAAVEEVKRRIDKVVPLCEKYNVKLGIQHHYGPMISNSMELYQLLKDYDPKYIGAIWDSAQSVLAGEEVEQGLDIIWPYLCLVNLKNVFYLRTNGPESEAKWHRYFTTGKQGLASWPRIAGYLKKRQYKGAVILTHEYSNQAEVNKLLAEDVRYAKSLFDERSTVK